MKLRGYRQMAGQLRPTSVWPPMTLHYYLICQYLPHWPAIIRPSSSQSTPNCPLLKGLVESTSTSRKQTGHVIMNSATNTLLKLAKQEQSNKPRRPSGRQLINPLASLFRPSEFNTSIQPCPHHPNRSPMNESENAD